MSVNPWPPDAIPHQLSILHEAERLVSLIDIMIYEGLNKRDWGFVRALAPRVRPRVRTICKTARFIEQLDQRERGRRPQWLRVAQQAMELATELLELDRKLRVAIARENWAIVPSLLSEALSYQEQIIDNISSVPISHSYRLSLPTWTPIETKQTLNG